MKRIFLAIAVSLLAADAAHAGHFYGQTPAENDPPIDAIDGVLFGNGSVSGSLPAGQPQPDEVFDHVVFHANAGDVITVDTLGTNADPGLAILFDTALDGIFVGDAPPNTGTQLTFMFADDDSAGGLNSLITFTAQYTGAYLASITEIGGSAMNWTINVQGSSAVPEPSSLVLAGLGALGLLGYARRANRKARAAA